MIRDKTYLVQDTAVLSRVCGLLDNIILDMQQNLVIEEGIPLEPTGANEKKTGHTARAKYLPLKKWKGKKI